jgi:uncharacterized protein (TIGR02466 family)
MASPATRSALREAAAALGRGDAHAARGAAERALSIDAGDPDAMNLLALARHALGDLDGARAALEAAVATKPDYRNAWDNLVALLDAAGRPREAAQAAVRAVDAQAQPTVDTLCEAGARAFAAGLLAPAARLIERAHAQAPQSRRALRSLAVVRDAQRHPTEARALIAQALAAPGAGVAERADFAAIWSRATEPADLARALAEALRVVDESPGHVGARDCAAIVLGKLGRREEARAMAAEAVRVAPGNADARFTLARLLEEDGRLDEAAAVVDDPAAEATPDPRLRRLAGTVRLRRGDPRAAADDFARALALAPDDQSAIAQRGLALQVAGEADAARAWLGEDRFIHPVRPAVPAPFIDATDFLAQLADDIRGHSRLRFEPVGLAAKGGYLTEDLLADRTPAIVGFERVLREAIDDYIAALPDDPGHPFLRAVPRDGYTLHLWATRVAAQGVIDTHIHEESWISGAYYVALPPALGADDPAGWIEYGRPHRGLPLPPETALRRYRPEPGLLLLFPSYLYHRTLPFEGAGERISISFDLRAGPA